MEEVLQESDEIFKKINLIESFISLHLRRDKIEPHIQELANKTEEVKSLIQQCNEVMKFEYDTAMNEYKLIMRKMQEQQIQFLDMLIEKRKNEATKNGSNRNEPLKQINVNAAASVGSDAFATDKSYLSVKKAPGDGKMYLEEYLQSPFVRKTRPLSVPFQFMDFEAKITPEMFETIPKYMRGRETVDELKQFLDAILVPCFNEKYQLLHRHRDCIRNHVDLDLWKVYKDQASYFPGQNFITQGDISRKINKMLDKKSQNKITMLRHLGILQEQRKAQTVCYIWTANNI
ncbi:uncharacterized protein LOC129914860 [Episyrphus balteatus]|uniref:uncharacterized protein LOC129914860 n=1 Tax=Episyrphus balteatus TaxID=286459 RepID=UPI002486A6CB|nr:uncharacterized protein LOC129914860 [Episyrphus balteatus]